VVEDDEDRWYGVFQGYRPHGDGVEEVFVGVPDAEQYAARFREVCAASYHDDWARDGYFVVRCPRPALEAELVALGGELLDGLRVLAKAAGRDGRPLLSLLSGVGGAEVVPSSAFPTKHPHHIDVVYAAGDVLPGRGDYGNRIVQLREGFYSVACDFWLSHFLQWPYYQDWLRRDVFRPYFGLWARGYRCSVQPGVMQLAPDAEPIAALDPAGT
jgi:hypothetical protein